MSCPAITAEPTGQAPGARRRIGRGSVCKAVEEGPGTSPVRGERHKVSDTATVTVDGGASGCRLAAFGADGALRAGAVDGPASLTLGEAQAWRHIARGLRTLAGELGLPPHWLPPVLCLGLAGALQRERRERFIALLPASIECRLVTDGHAQLLGASGGEPGACLAVGTGSVLHWLDGDGRDGMAGGWGFPAGDEGSGAWLGLRAIGAYLRARDEAHRVLSGSPLASPGSLFAALEERIGTDVSSVQSWSTRTVSTELASLAPLVVAAAGRDDPVAVSLLDEGAVRCAALFAVAPSDVPLYLVGGLAGVYRTRLPANIRARLREPRGGPLEGLLSLGRVPAERPA